MRAVLAAYGDETRSVWLADSFEGVPRSDPENYQADKGIRAVRRGHTRGFGSRRQGEFPALRAARRPGPLFPGRFKDTLHDAPIEHIAVLRLTAIFTNPPSNAQCAVSEIVPWGFLHH